MFIKKCGKKAGLSPDARPKNNKIFLIYHYMTYQYVISIVGYGDFYPILEK